MGLRLLRRLLFSCLMIFSHAAWPQSVAECSVSATGLNFGAYNPLDPAPLDSTGEVQVRCSLLGLVSLLVNYNIELGTGGSGSYAGRILQSGSDTLGYQMYRDASRATVWGNGTGGTAEVADSYLLGVLTTTRTYTVYGRIAGGQNVSAGVYNDTIVVTLNF